MAVVRQMIQPFSPETGLTWARWVDGRLQFFSWREGGSRWNFTVRLKWGWLPVAFYIAAPIFGHWFRFHGGRLMPWL